MIHPIVVQALRKLPPKLERAQLIRLDVRRLLRRVSTRPLDNYSWLPSQIKWFSCDAHIKLYRAGNQALGKTTAGLAEIIWRCLGKHPFIDVPEGPIEAWIICASWGQSIAIQEKLWELLPKDLIEPKTKFDTVNGFHANHPTVSFLNGSIIRFKTAGQNTLDLSSASIDVALFDEPPKKARVFGEVLKRVMKANGHILMTLTPVNADVGWLHEMTLPNPDTGARPVVLDFHARLNPEAMIPVGETRPIRLKDGTPCDADWIAEVIRLTVPHEVPVVVHGEWEMRVEGNVFRSFIANPDIEGAHVVNDIPDIEYDLRFGTDHGSGAHFEEYALLIGTETHGEHARVFVVDEYVTDGETTTAEDATAILAMLARHGLEWRWLDHAYGDRVWAGRKGEKGGKKSNERLMRAIAKTIGMSSSRRLQPRIRTVKKGRGHGPGSVDLGVEWLHRAMVRGHFFVHARCARLIESLQKWDRRDTEWKHAIDTLRYALDDLIFDVRKSKRAQAVLYG